MNPYSLNLLLERMPFPQIHTLSVIYSPAFDKQRLRWSLDYISAEAWEPCRFSSSRHSGRNYRSLRYAKILHVLSSHGLHHRSCIVRIPGH